MSHTKGPWKVSVHSQGISVLDVTYKLFDTPKTMDEMHANVKLIAAAPEMLDALEHLINVCEPRDIGGANWEWISDIVKKARGQVE